MVCPAIIFPMLGMQEKLSFTVCLLKILDNRVLGGETRVKNFEKFFSNLSFNGFAEGWVEPNCPLFPASFEFLVLGLGFFRWLIL